MKTHEVIEGRPESFVLVDDELACFEETGEVHEIYESETSYMCGVCMGRVRAIFDGEKAIAEALPMMGMHGIGDNQGKYYKIISKDKLKQYFTLYKNAEEKGLL